MELSFEINEKRLESNKARYLLFKYNDHKDWAIHTTFEESSTEQSRLEALQKAMDYYKKIPNLDFCIALVIQTTEILPEYTTKGPIKK